jgi:hypothetical protein
LLCFASDVKLEDLRVFTQAVVESRGWLLDEKAEKLKILGQFKVAFILVSFLYDKLKM